MSPPQKHGSADDLLKLAFLVSLGGGLFLLAFSIHTSRGFRAADYPVEKHPQLVDALHSIFSLYLPWMSTGNLIVAFLIGVYLWQKRKSIGKPNIK